MNTILVAVLGFLGTSVAGGITWDALKAGASKIINSFKSHFTEQNQFPSEEEAEVFLKKLSEAESYNDDDPLQDVWNIYKKTTGQTANDAFQKMFIAWAKDCGKFLPLETIVNQTNIHVGKINASDSSTVTVIGTQNN